MDAFENLVAEIFWKGGYWTQTSFKVDLSKEEISARGADKFLAGKLQVDPGSPILVRKRFVFDQADRPIEFNLGYYRADSFVYTIESRRDQ